MQGVGNIEHHHGQIDPTDFQVDDVLLCLKDRHGLSRGRLYVAHEVSRRRIWDGVATFVTVIADRRLVLVPRAEEVLVRTRFLVEAPSEDGSVTTHSFPNLEVFRMWAEDMSGPGERCYEAQYVPAQPLPQNARFAAMCIPGSIDEGSESEWYVHDLACRTSEPVRAGIASRRIALEMARGYNRAWRAVGEPSHE